MNHQTLSSIPCGNPKQTVMAALEQNVSILADDPTSRHPDSNATFKRLWKHSTEDNNLTLYGFRRFKTSHLLNLRYLEEEISRVDHDIYQAGLRSGCVPGERDRLGLRYSKRDPNSSQGNEIFNNKLISDLRTLLKEYGKVHGKTKYLMLIKKR